MTRFSDTCIHDPQSRARADRQPADALLAGFVGRVFSSVCSAWTTWRRRRRRRMAVWELFRLNDRLLSDMGLDRGRIQSYLEGLENDPTLKSRQRRMEVEAVPFERRSC